MDVGACPTSRHAGYRIPAYSYEYGAIHYNKETQTLDSCLQYFDVLPPNCFTNFLCEYCSS